VVVCPTRPRSLWCQLTPELQRLLGDLRAPGETATAPLLTPESLITADAGYHSEANFTALRAQSIDALIADNAMRRRDAQFATQARHQETPDPLHDKTLITNADDATGVFHASEFAYDAAARTCVCPAGKSLNRNGGAKVIRDDIWRAFHGKASDCGPCSLRAQCITDPERTRVRSVMFFRGTTPPLAESQSARMQRHIDTPEGRARYGRRFAAVEPCSATWVRTKRAHAFHAARKGRRTMEAILPRAQHRAARARRVHGVGAVGRCGTAASPPSPQPIC
jgi:hypothetical protein